MEIYTGTFNKDTVHRCSNCNTSLSSETEYKEHYKTEFHRYNLKRRSVNLPPATIEQFNAKKASDSAKAGAPEEKHCDRCNKSFSSQTTYQQHLKSRKHQQTPAQTAPQRKAKPAEQAKEQQTDPEKCCLFCRHSTSTFDGNLAHMSISHGFFIPQREYCMNPKGLISYLHQKISTGLMCILCDNKGTKDFTDREALRNHMRDKSHCFMNVDDGYEEYEEYYDFGKLFEEKIQEQKQYKKIVGIEQEHVEIEEEDKDAHGEPKDDWESVDGGSDDDEEEVEEQVKEEKQPKKAQPLKEITEQKRKVKTNKYVFFRPTLTRTGQLLLPSGNILGHKKFRHIYRQYYRPHWVKPSLKALTGGNWETANQIVKRNFQLQLVKQTNAMEGFKNKLQVRHLRLKLQQNRLQYYFRVQNPK